jgi:hypothetical protein
MTVGLWLEAAASGEGRGKRRKIAKTTSAGAS